MLLKKKIGCGFKTLFKKKKKGGGGLKSWTVVFHLKKPQSCWILPFISFLPLSSVLPRPSLSLLHIKDALLIQKSFVRSFYVSQLDGSISCLGKEEERRGRSVFRGEEITPQLLAWYSFLNVCSCVNFDLHDQLVSLPLSAFGMWSPPSFLIGPHPLTLLKLPRFYNGF